MGDTSLDVLLLEIEKEKNFSWKKNSQKKNLLFYVVFFDIQA